MDLYAIADDGAHEIRGDGVTLRTALPALHLAMNEAGGPFSAWFKKDLYVVMRLAGGDVKIDTYDGSTFTEVHTAASAFVDASAGACVIAAEGSIHVLTYQATNVIRRFSSTDGVAWVATDHTGTFGATGLAMWNPTYYRGKIYLLLGTGSGAAVAGDFASMVAIDLSSNGLTEHALTATAGTDHYGLGIHNGFIYICRMSGDVVAGFSLQVWDGTHFNDLAITPVSVRAERPAVFELDGKLWVAARDTTAAELAIWVSSDFGATWVAAGFPFLPLLSATTHVSAVIDDAEIPGSRAVYLQLSATTGSPGLDLMRLVETSTPGLYSLDVRAADSSVDAGASLASFTRGYPHATVDTVTDNGNGKVSVTFTVYDGDSEAVDAAVLYSLDRSGNYQVGTWEAGQVVTALASTPGGTQHTKVWHSGLDLAGGGEIPLVAVNLTKN